MSQISEEDTLVPPIHDSEWEDIFERNYPTPMEEYGLPPSDSSDLLEEEVLF